jgi:hypothetical protein
MEFLLSKMIASFKRWVDFKMVLLMRMLLGRLLLRADDL